MRFVLASRLLVVSLLTSSLLQATGPLLAEESPARHPVPDAETLKEAKKLLQQVYGQAYQDARTAEAKTALARRILDQAAESKEEPATRFALLDIAQQIAQQAGDVETALEAAGRIGEAFEVDAMDRQAEALEKTAEAALGDAARIALAEKAVELMDAALEQGAIEPAVRFREVAISVARRTRTTPFIKKIVAATDHLKEHEKHWTAYREALEKLAKDPIDAEANLAAGRYLCLIQGDWARGVAMLALSSDADLKALAARELEGPDTAEAQAGMGDGWWEWAQRQQGRDKDSAMLRAGAWYRKAEPNVEAALLRVKLQERLRLVEKIGRPVPEAVASTSPAGRTKRPPEAIAPFDAEKAVELQRLWAEYLGTPVEYTNELGIKFILIPPGAFLMGTSEEEMAKLVQEAKKDNQPDYIFKSLAREMPQHRVRISRPFYFGKYHVTAAQFGKFVEATGYKTTAETNGKGTRIWRDGRYQYDPALNWRDNADVPMAPANCLSWLDSAAFCKWLSEETRAAYRLPTEAEWEYTCRAGTTTRYHFGDDSSELGGFCRNVPAAVDQKKPNPWGIYGLVGMPQTWCLDWTNDHFYRVSPEVDPRGPPQGTARAKRGDGYFMFPLQTRAAWRAEDSPDEALALCGIRLVYDPFRTGPLPPKPRSR